MEKRKSLVPAKYQTPAPQLSKLDSVFPSLNVADFCCGKE
jgi:hypothetical protein